MNTELATAPGLIGRWGMNEASGTFVGNSTPSLGAPTFTIETWFRRDGAGARHEHRRGGITAIPLVTKGRARLERRSNRDMNYFLGIEASDE